MHVQCESAFQKQPPRKMHAPHKPTAAFFVPASMLYRWQHCQSCGSSSYLCRYKETIKLAQKLEMQLNVVVAEKSKTARGYEATISALRAKLGGAEADKVSNAPLCCVIQHKCCCRSVTTTQTDRHLLDFMYCFQQSVAEQVGAPAVGGALRLLWSFPSKLSTTSIAEKQ